MQFSEFSLQLPVTDPTLIFFLVLVIILFAPVILERLHIPHIVGLILAGVLVGQHGFNILKQDSSFDLFGKVGLYYIMFLAGLEMNMEDFKSTILSENNSGMPRLIIANTIKGKGVSIMENNPNWHFRLPGRKELKIFKEELGISDEELV